MYCKNCGKEIDIDSKFCTYCGTKQSLIQIPENKKDLNSKTEPLTQNVNVSSANGKSNYGNKRDEVKIDKYDQTYEGDLGTTLFASAIIITCLILYFAIEFDNESDQHVYQATAGVINVIWRIVATFWAINIAKRQNRNTSSWGFFAFFLPNIALFIIGLLKKLYKPQSSSEKLEVGSVGQITYKENGGDTDSDSCIITYKVTKKEPFFSLWRKGRYEIVIKFSDGQIGKLFFATNKEEYYFKRNSWINHYYHNKETAIKALHYFLYFHKVPNEDRFRSF